MLNRPLPLSPVQILWVNMVTTITLSYALGFESPDPEIMKRPPRDPKQGILSGYHLFRIIYVSLLIMVPAYLLAMQFEGQSLQQTILLQNIVLAQAVYMINCRELSKPSLNQGLLQNKALFLSLGILALLQGMVIFLPVGQQLIGTVSLTMTQQLLIGANVILLFLVVEIEKGIMNKLFRKKKKQLENTVASRYYKKVLKVSSVKRLSSFFVGIEEMYTIGISRESRGNWKSRYLFFQKK